MDYSHLEFVKEEDPLALDEEKTELDIEINDFDHEKESFLSQDDPHVASLECHVTGCEFITEPVDLKLLKVAANMLKLHMLGAHRKDKLLRLLVPPVVADEAKLAIVFTYFFPSFPTPSAFHPLRGISRA